MRKRTLEAQWSYLAQKSGKNIEHAKSDTFLKIGKIACLKNCYIFPFSGFFVSSFFMDFFWCRRGIILGMILAL